ncbi:MAG TPA: ester cyclase [Polyangiaceae bacterium]|nr:ester cyclase [Polyangiaceae bacterium]
MTQQNQNRDLALNLYRAVDAQDEERLRALVSPRCQSYMGGNQLDFASWLAMGRMFMSAFPNGRHVFDLTEAAGDYVLLHGYFTGTHTGEFQGLPATGRTIKISLTMIDKVVDGKLVEHYGDFDTGGLMQQLTQRASA